MVRRMLIALAAAVVSISATSQRAHAVICASPSYCVPYCPNDPTYMCNQLAPPYCYTISTSCDYWFNGCGFGGDPYRLTCDEVNY